jgi:hypothetical protein
MPHPMPSGIVTFCHGVHEVLTQTATDVVGADALVVLACAQHNRCSRPLWDKPSCITGTDSCDLGLDKLPVVVVDGWLPHIPALPLGCLWAHHLTQGRVCSSNPNRLQGFFSGVGELRHCWGLFSPCPGPCPVAGFRAGPDRREGRRGRQRRQKRQAARWVLVGCLFKTPRWLLINGSGILYPVSRLAK